MNIVPLIYILLLLGSYAYGNYQGAERAKLRDARDNAQAWKTADLARDQKETAYEREIEQLKNDALTEPTVAVRLCPQSPGPSLPAVHRARQELRPAAGALPRKDAANRDIGPALFALADEADRLAAKCRAD